MAGKSGEIEVFIKVESAFVYSLRLSSLPRVSEYFWLFDAQPPLFLRIERIEHVRGALRPYSILTCRRLEFVVPPGGYFPNLTEGGSHG